MLMKLITRAGRIYGETVLHQSTSLRGAVLSRSRNPLYPICRKRPSGLAKLFPPSVFEVAQTRVHRCILSFSFLRRDSGELASFFPIVLSYGTRAVLP